MTRAIGEKASTTWLLNNFFWTVVLCTGYQKESDENLNIFLGQKK